MTAAKTANDDLPSFAINGIGAMGRGLAHQLVRVNHARLVGLSDTDIARAAACAAWLGLDGEVVATADAAERAIRRGKVAVAADGGILAACSAGDVLFEASSAVAEVADGVLAAIDNGKHVMMMNSEADLAFAPLFAERAAAAGVVYSSADGDQYGVIKRLAGDVSAWGFDLVMLGNIKGFLDRRANPTTIIPEADIRHLDYRMCTAYTDGTKLAIEMAIIANALDARPTSPGMSGPRAKSVSEVPSVFALAEMWDGRTPLVDYILGAEPGGGIFVVGHSTDPYVRDMMRYYKMGEGPFYVFYRPYHLCHVEAVAAAIAAVRQQRPLMQPTRPNAEVVAYAKVPIAADTALDGIGGYACYGLIEERGADDGLPVCLSGYVRARRAFAQDERIRLADVEVVDQRALALFEAARRCTQ